MYLCISLLHITTIMRRWVFLVNIVTRSIYSTPRQHEDVNATLRWWWNELVSHYNHIDVIVSCLRHRIVAWSSSCHGVIVIVQTCCRFNVILLSRHCRVENQHWIQSESLRWAITSCRVRGRWPFFEGLILKTSVRPCLCWINKKTENETYVQLFKSCKSMF